MTAGGEHEDATLVRLMANGDGEAFTVLYRRYLPVVLRWALRQTGNRELAADLTAEVFAASLPAARRYRSADGTVGAWLLGIAQNKLRESRRRKRVEDSARRRLGLEPAVLTDTGLDRVDELVSLDGVALDRVQALPADQRDAVLWHVIDERSYAEIAAELSCSASVVRQRVSRGLRTLRAEMEEQ